MKFQDLAYKKIAIWGMGKEGLAVQRVLSEKVSTAHLFFVTEENLNDLQHADVIVKSPGVSLYRSEIQTALKKGILLTSSTNLFLQNKSSSTKVIAITGTKGKSTTSSLLYHCLKQLGVKTALGGNIGVPLIDLVDEKDCIVVAELSSYQTADLKGNIDLAILTNLYPEHLQWHLTHQTYYHDKINMLLQAKKVLFNKNHEKSVQEARNFQSPLFYMDEIYFKEGLFYDKDNPLFKTSSLPLKGEHNLENACAVLACLKELGLPLTNVQQAFESFIPLRHRLEIIGTKNGITYVDDSISTTPETAIAAVKAFDAGQFITLIIGGTDRGQDYQELINFLTPLKNRILLITLPDTGKRAFDLAQQSSIPALQAQNMQEAVQLANNNTKENGTVLLSPAAPSYNLYTNFEARGDDFKTKIFNSKCLNHLDKKIKTSEKVQNSK